MKIKIYFPNELIYTSRINDMFILIKAKLRVEQKQKNVKNFKEILKHVSFVNDIAIANLVVLPQDWNVYFRLKKVKEVMDFVTEVSKSRKIIISSTSGDFGISQDLPMNCIVYRITGYKSKLKPNERIFPFYLTDPIKAMFGDGEDSIINRKSNPKPTVGFCGMAPNAILLWMKEIIKIWVRNFLGQIGQHPYDQQDVLSSSRLRVRCLEVFKNSGCFDTKYIIRNRYRAGTKKNTQIRVTTTQEYYQNQRDSDLIICARGGGNFSVRFYETLAMGRIPIFIDTDSPLPDISPLNWKDHIIICDSKNVKNLPQITAKWLKGKELKEVFAQNRRLWKDKLFMSSFWINEFKYLMSEEQTQ